MREAKFGPAGNASSFPGKSSVEAPAWLRSMGLDAYEYQSGKGVNVGQGTAVRLGEEASRHNIALSLHAPYFINLANPDPARLEQTIGYIIAACRAADWMGAGRVIVHTGALMKRSREEALSIAQGSMVQVLRACDEAGFGHISLCPETMGKINQLGTLEEVLALCQLDERLIPCVDFGHLYARSLGEAQGEAATEYILDRILNRVGEERARAFHIHFSKIEFTQKGGEVRHLTFDQPEFGPDFTPLGRALARRGWGPIVICESAGTQAEDAVAMQTVYRGLLSGGTERA